MIHQKEVKSINVIQKLEGMRRIIPLNIYSIIQLKEK